MKQTIQIIAVILLSLLASTAVLGESITVVLNDGTTWRGEVNDTVTVAYRDGRAQKEAAGVLTRAGKLYLVIDLADGSGETAIFRSDIISVSDSQATREPAESTEPAATPSGGTPASDPGEGTTTSSPVGETKATPSQGTARGVFRLPLTGTVGLEFRPEEVQEIIDQADAAGPGQIIVLDIESGGGSVREFINIGQIIQEGKTRHTFVAWVGHAISAAAATALCCDRIVYKSHGALGAITMHSGGNPVSDAMEEKWVTMLEDFCKESGRSPYWARPMVKNVSFISYIKDPITGDCEYFNSRQDVPQEVILSNYDENLVMNVDLALECCFADGRADNTDELAEILDLASWNEIGTGQELSDDWLATCEQCKEYMRKSRAELARGWPGADERVVIRNTIKIYQKWIRWWKRAPNQMGGLAPPVKQLEQMIEELERQLRDLGRG